MAILKKRTSSKQIPEAKALNRAPLSSVIQGKNKAPSISGGSSSLTSSGSSPSITTSTGAPQTSLTSTTGSKPAVTSTTSKTPTSITSSPSTVPKQTVKPKTTNPNSTTSKVVNALSGAALGAGTKLLMDKFSSKPNVSKTPAQVAAENKAKSDAAARDRVAAKAKADAAKPKPVVPSGPRTDTQIQAELDKKAAEANNAVKPPVPDEFSTDEKGNIYKVMPDGTEVLYRAAEAPEDVETSPLKPDENFDQFKPTEKDYGAFGEDPTEGGNLVSKDVVSGLGNDQIAALDPQEPAFEPQYFDDGYGNIYISTADGGYDLYRAAEVEDDGEAFTETPYEPEYFEDSLGNIYMQGESGEYELYRAAEVPEDIVEEDYGLFNGDNTDYYDYNDYIDYQPDERYATEDDGDEYYDYRRGGLITMMKQGGVAHMADGGYMPEGAVDNGDGTYTIGRFTYDMMTDEYLYSTDDGQITNVNSDAVYSTDPEEDYYDTDSLGNVFKNGEYYYSEEPEVTSSGGGERPWYKDIGSKLSKGFQDLTGVSDETLGKITGALPAAGAGALVATLLGSDFGGSEDLNQGLDMSKVGVINPRTTDFGIGPTKFVGYEDYGTGGGDYAPNEELLRNLNAPGFNPVNEGDYGYEEVAAEEPTEEAPKMASGGLSSMATPVASYYTFGQPADILANLGMRPQPPMNPPEMMPQIGQQQSPQQTQQQGLPQQAPPQMKQQAPQGMPQQGIMPQQQGMAPPMRKGGLPHASNVPMVEGRMDFRKGSAVHGAGDGQSDDIPAMLADGEYVIDAETVAQIGNGSTKAGAQALDKFRESIRAHKRSAPINKIPPKTKVLTSYLKGAR